MKHPIPTAALDDRLGFFGTAGSGKTYGSGTAVERVLNSGSRCVIVDPLGVWWGLRLREDGKTESKFDVVIFGGPHGDLPLTENSGALIGEAVATSKESCIIDLSQLGTKPSERRFMLAFLTAFYRHTTGEPVHLVFDEADMWAPQRLMDKDGDAAKLLGMMETIVRRGRVKGFIPWLISQRTAVISKDVLSQIDGLVIFKLTSSQDRQAIGDWIEGQADKVEGKAILAKLPTKQRGEAVVWIPGRGVLAEAPFPAKVTFDSSRTPKRGEKALKTGKLKELDVGKLKEKLATVETETKANDPKALKVEIARLRSELAKAPKKTETVEKVVADPKALAAAEQAGYDRGWSDCDGGWRARVATAQAKLQQNLLDALTTINPAKGGFKPQYKSASPAPVARSAAPAIAPRVAPPVVSGDGIYSGQELKVLRSLATWAALGHEHPSREMVAAVAGYKPTTGNYRNILSKLSVAGVIGRPSDGLLSLQDTGVEALTKDEARDVLLSVLKEPERRVMQTLVGVEMKSREQVAEESGYQPTTGNFRNILSKLNTYRITTKRTDGQVALSDWARELL